MLGFTKAVICSVLLATYAAAAPAPAVSSASASNASSAASSASASAPASVSTSVSVSVSSSAASVVSSSVVATTGSATSAAASASPTVPYASDDPNYPLWNETSDITPQAERGTLGATLMGPHDVQIELQNPDLLAPPTTDSGSV